MEITNIIFETYRKKLDIETEQLFKRNIQTDINQNHNLTKTEENRLKSLFWGTNFTMDDILKGIKDNNQNIINKLEKNLSKTIIKEILQKINFEY